MKKLYWRPQRISTRVRCWWPWWPSAATRPWSPSACRRSSASTRRRSARPAWPQAFHAIKDERERLHSPSIRWSTRANRADRDADLPGDDQHGALPAKLTSINPNWAAVVVDWLGGPAWRRGRGGRRDVGLLPALNIGDPAALEVLKAQPVIISSAGASQWGANIPRLRGRTWSACSTTPDLR